MENRRPSTGNLKTRISNLLSKESSSDVQFLVGTPAERYHCHKLILAAGSEVFEAMFYGSLQQKSPVRVPDVEPRGFALMLLYLYSDAVSIRDVSEAFDLAYASKKYILKGLFATCEDYLLSGVSLGPDTVLAVLEEASFLEMEKLRRRCLRYVSRNARKVFRSRSFATASRNTLEDVLRVDPMNVESEGEIIEALWLWGEERCRENGVECSVENVRDFTRGCLEHVRFSALTAKELAAVLEKFQLLDTADEMTMLWNLAMPKGSKPTKMSPNICSTDSRTRCIRDSPRIELPGQYRYDGYTTSFVIEKHRTEVEITISGPPITVIGAVVAFKPIPCYSSCDRSLHVEIFANNASSRASSRAKSLFKAKGKDEECQLLLLDDYLEVEEEQIASLTVTVSGEGVRLMQCNEETMFYNLGRSKLSFKFDKRAKQRKRLFPLKELMVF